MNKDKIILVLVATEEELPVDLPDPYLKHVTGIGKIQATLATTLAIQTYAPVKVINFGTAGSLNVVDYPSDLYQVGTMYQRDMDCTPIGYDIGQTPGSEYHRAINLGVTGPSVGTGDSFVTSRPTLLTDLVDMEAYAIGRVCQLFDKPLEVYKYVSDHADDTAGEEWQKNVSNGYQLFLDKVINNGTV